MLEFSSSSQSFVKRATYGGNMTEIQPVQKVKKTKKEGKDSMIFDHLRKKINEKSEEKKIPKQW